jgi:hypothetical protein
MQQVEGAVPSRAAHWLQRTQPGDKESCLRANHLEQLPDMKAINAAAVMMLVQLTRIRCCCCGCCWIAVRARSQCQAHKNE